MIELKEVYKKYGQVSALDGLTMTVPEGSVYGLIGPNGAGKSTAIRHIAGILRPDAGSITVNSQPVDDNAAIKGRMGYISDDVFYLPGANLEDMHRYYRGMFRRFDEGMYARLAEVFGLPKGVPLRRFSKGMQKQAAFYLTLCTRPDILILDEPVDGLDPVMRRQVWSMILADVAEHGATVLISSHNLREMEDICDRVGIMNRGKMLLERSLEEIQGTTVKLQMVGEAPAGLDILHTASSGRLNTYIVRGTPQSVEAAVTRCAPAYFEVLPLTMEEIFIYELGGVDYEVKQAVL